MKSLCTFTSALKCPNPPCPGAVVANKSVVLDPKTDLSHYPTNVITGTGPQFRDLLKNSLTCP